METDQWNTADNPVANPYNCGHLIFDSDIKNILEKKRALSINGVSNGGCPSAEK